MWLYGTCTTLIQSLNSDLGFLIYFLVLNPQASAPSTAETGTGGGAIIRKPRSAWLEGTPANGSWKNGKRIYMKSNKRDIEQIHIKKHGAWMKNTHVEQ